MENLTQEKLEEIKKNWAEVKKNMDKIDQCVQDLENCKTEVVRNMIGQMIFKYADTMGVKLA